MFEKKGVVAKRKQSKMFLSPPHDKMTTGHYNPAGTDHGVGIPPQVGTEKETDKEIIPRRSNAWKCDDFDE